MTVSDLSAQPINPNAEAELIISVRGARDRRLAVTASEADSFAALGEPVPGPFRGIWAAARRNWKTGLWWGLGLVVASLMLPAATKQWSDRQAALTLKSELISEISKSTVTAVTGAQPVLNSANEDEARTAREGVMADWSINQANIDPLFHTYFENQEVIDVWDEYNDRVDDYVSLSCCEEDREETVNALQAYYDRRLQTTLPVPGEDPWSILRRHEPGAAYEQTYAWLGLQLLRERGDILDALRLATPAGYSSGFLDFWGDVFPFGDLRQ